MRRERAGSPPSQRGAYHRGRPPSFPGRSSPPLPDNGDPCKSDRLSARAPADQGEKNRRRRNLPVAQDWVLVTLRAIDPELPSRHLLGGLESSSRSPSQLPFVP